MTKNFSKLYKDNPNPEANIGFICYVPLNFYVYKNIYRHLPNAEFIVGEEYDFEPFGQVSNSLENLLFFFSRQKVYWRFIDNYDTKISKSEFYSKYALLVSTWYRDPVSALYNKDKKLVRAMYCHAKDPWNYGLWNVYFDLILAYGEYSQKFLSIYNNSIIIGNPKFDDWFLNDIDKKAMLEIKQILNPTKETILYLPTHGALSSLELMAYAFNSISRDYNLILKAHHNTYLYEQDRLEPYRQNHRIIIKNDQDDILPLLKLADFVVSDNSGAIFDAVLADKPIILIDFLDEQFFEMYKGNFFYRGQGKQFLGVATNQNSIEQMIKLPGEEIGPIIKIRKNDSLSNLRMHLVEKELKNALTLAKEKEGEFSSRRKKYRDLAFSYNDGGCGKRAAEKIQELLYKPKPAPGFLAEALDRYYDYFITARIGMAKSDFWPSKRRLKEAAKRYLHIRSLPFWQRLIAVANEFFGKELR